MCATLLPCLAEASGTRLVTARTTGGGRQLILELRIPCAQMKHAHLGLRLGAAQARMRRLAAANASAKVDAGGSPRAVRGAGSVARGGRASLVHP